MAETLGRLPEQDSMDMIDDPGYVLISLGKSYKGSKYVNTFTLADGRRVEIRFARRLPSRPLRIVSDDQPGAGDRTNRDYPYLVEEITLLSHSLSRPEGQVQR